MTRSKKNSFGYLFRTALIVNTLSVLALLAGLALSSGGVLNAVPSPEKPQAGDAGTFSLEPVQSRAERLSERHGCWTGEAPAKYAGKVPGHAIVTLPGHRAERANSEVGFAIWLGADGKAGTGDERDGTLHSFCP